MNSAELLARYNETGAEEAFQELVRRHADLVFSVAKRRLGSAALAEEAAQIVFIRLAANQPRIASEGALLGWLHRTTLHVSIDLVRSEMRRRLREEKSMQTEIRDEQLLWDEIVPFLDQALDRLRDEERAILLLRFFDRKPFAEVGAAFQISEDAAKMRVARAVDKLRDLLTAQKIYCTAAVLSALLLNRVVEAAPSAIVPNVMARRSSLPRAETGLRLRRKGVLIGTGSLLLIGTLLVTSSWRAERNLNEPEQITSATHSTAPDERGSITSPGNMATVRRKFDPVTTRTILSLRDSETGAPIAGARVHMAYFYAGGVGEGHKRISDDDGDVSIPFPEKEGNPGANIFVTAEGYVPKCWRYRDPFPETYQMNLDPALTFAGNVVDEEGQPVSNVTVTLNCRSFELDTRKIENVVFNSPETASVTDEAGTFSLPFVPRELPTHRHFSPEVRLTLTAGGFEITQTNFPAPITARTDLKLVIRKGIVVTGRVVDPTGAPVGNVSVRELHNFGVRTLRTHTDDQGRFVLNGVWRQAPEKQVRIVIQPNDWACQEKSIPINAHTNIVDFTLAKSPVFRAVVRDEDGGSLADVTVRTDSDNQGIRTYEWLDKTNVDGRVEWPSAPAEPTLFWFEKDGYHIIRGLPLTPNGTEFEITLQRKTERPVEHRKISYRFYHPSEKN